MKFSNISGHLTSVEKKAIKAIIEAKMSHAKVGRKIYLITFEAENVSVLISENATNDFGQPIVKKYKSTFKIS